MADAQVTTEQALKQAADALLDAWVAAGAVAAILDALDDTIRGAAGSSQAHGLLDGLDICVGRLVEGLAAAHPLADASVRQAKGSAS